MTDQTIPADKVKKLAARFRQQIEPHVPFTECVVWERAAEAVEALLPAPTPPTLEDMTPEERDECQWMQADVKDYEITAGIITKITPTDAHLLAGDGEIWFLEFDTVTPRPDLPRLEWPGDKKPDHGPALPDGWRVADHKDNGRVIVTNPTPTRDGRVYYVLPADDYVLGYDWLFCTPDELTYLDTDDTERNRND